ncbi:hypothetical protein Tco_1205012 [Tanacetum coccineum]
MEESLCRQFRGDRHRGMLTLEEGHFARQCTQPKRPKNSTWFKEKMLLTEALESRAYLDPEQLAFLADNGDTVIPAQASQEIISLAAFQADDLDAFDSDCDDVPSAKAVLMANLSSYDSDVLSECSEQPCFDNDTEVDITSDSNIISYEQYLQETKNLVVQSTSSSVQQDELLIYVIEKMSSQVAKCNKVQQENLIVNETLTAELERYKEQVIIFEQRKKFNLNNRENYIDGQLRQVIVDRNAKVADFEKQIHLLKLQLNATVESHKTLSTIVECLKKASKQKEDKYLDEIIDLQKKKKALDNVVYKMGQSTQTMHMLTKPQAFYNESHKTTLGYQNPFYLSQARRKVPALYDGHTIVKTHVTLSVTDTEETLELAEESRLKMLAKQNDPSVKEKKVTIAPVYYVPLNKISEHFVKHFVPQKQLSAEQAYWLPISQPVVVNPPVPSEPVLKKEIPYKKYFEIQKKELNLDNDRLLEHIICQDIMNTVMHANDHYDNVLPANNNSLVHDNFALDLLKHENDRLMELLISQDLVHTAVNSLAAINDYKSMEQSFVDE